MRKKNLASLLLAHRRVVLLTVLLALLLTGFVGEAAAHNPAGIGVPGCENGTAVVAHSNPNCH